MSSNNKSCSDPHRCEQVSMRVGTGYDVHRLKSGLPLLLGGTEINHDAGLSGHSDADVVLHAVADALLGATALGDIGEHFPDTDPKWKGADSTMIVQKTCSVVTEKGYEIQNLDINILAQKPRLGKMKIRIRENIARLLGLNVGRVNVKAKTKEGLGAVGAGEAIEAIAVVLIKKV